jgi:RNA polymerase sigma-70 factor, ECF subfamily
MDTSIRFYNTNSSLRSLTEVEEERRGPTTSSLPADNHSHEGVAQEREKEALTLSRHNDAVQSESLSSSGKGAREEREQGTNIAGAVDIAEFETIFLRFQIPITNFIYHLIGNREQASDLAQDVFVKAYKALLNGTVVQPGALSAWLYRIAANTTTDSLRRRRLISWLPLSLFNEDRGIGAGVVSDSGGPSDGFGSDEQTSEARTTSVSTMYERGGYDGGRFESRVADREIVERVFNQLPSKYATCLWLYENDGLSCAEIAEVLNISASAVKMRLMRARERFIMLYNKEVDSD